MPTGETVQRPFASQEELPVTFVLPVAQDRLNEARLVKSPEAPLVQDDAPDVPHPWVSGALESWLLVAQVKVPVEEQTP